MGKADAITRKYMKNPMIFADAFNQYLYHGNQKIDPAQLTEHRRNRCSLWGWRCQCAGTEIQGCVEAFMCYDRRQDNTASWELRTRQKSIMRFRWRMAFMISSSCPIRSARRPVPISSPWKKNSMAEQSNNQQTKGKPIALSLLLPL